MLPHNHLVAADFERQSRDRIQQAAENSRKLSRNFVQRGNKRSETSRKPILSLGWLKGLRLNPAS
jgi:hypothetical protein